MSYEARNARLAGTFDSTGVPRTCGDMINVVGILICYSLIVILAMPDHFAMPRDDSEEF
jgi:hypothetical protein